MIRNCIRYLFLGAMAFGAEGSLYGAGMLRTAVPTGKSPPKRGRRRSFFFSRHASAS